MLRGDWSQWRKKVWQKETEVGKLRQCKELSFVLWYNWNIPIVQVNQMKTAELAGTKLSMLFFAQTMGIPLTNEHITEFFIKTYFLNYFDLQQLLVELVESQHLAHMEGRQSHYYTLTDKGREALDFFQNRIQPHIRQDILNYANNNRDRLRKPADCGLQAAGQP